MLASRSVRSIVVLAAAIAALGAAPPELVNYQGVLRDAANRPQSGTFDMVFRLFDAASGGNEILLDAHTGGVNGVPVVNGLFTVQLGGGTVSDGSGPGTFTSLSDALRALTTVWLEITVGSETLVPRVRIRSAAFAQNASHLDGHPPGDFLDTTSSPQTKTGPVTLDTTASGGLALNVSAPSQGAAVSGGSSYAGFAINDAGVWASGASYGGIFQNGSSGAYAYLGASSYGVMGFGAGGEGGRFQDASGDAASAATGGYGVYVTGSSTGGGFASNLGSGRAALSEGDYGVRGFGNAAGGYFADSNGSGYAQLGHGDDGIDAHGSAAGGWFESGGWGTASTAAGGFGLAAYGRYPFGSAGYFKDAVDAGEAYVGYGDTGLLAYGTATDPYAYHVAASFADSPTAAVLSTSFGYAEGGGIFETGSFYFTYPLRTRLASYLVGSGLDSTGSKNFLENHPQDPTRSIAYACLEGDEVGTYTRGSARLVGGEARVKLGETFRWVTNPDVGLTAQVSPRGRGAHLYVASLTTEELVVRSGDPSPVEVDFDYRVHGLRIGFDEAPTTFPRKDDAPLPSGSSLQDIHADHPELAATSPRARFLGMETALGTPPRVDFARTSALEARIGRGGGSLPMREVPEDAVAATERDRGPRSPAAIVLAPFSVNGPVRAGDVLAFEVAASGRVRLAGTGDDNALVGVAAGGPAAEEGQALVAVGGLASCNVDASYGPIAPGDLLVTSPTPGRAMAARTPSRGPAFAKALEPLEAGTGTIRVLLLAH